MSIESAADWEGLRAAARIARRTLDLLAREVRAGVTTGQLDGLAARLFVAEGAGSAPARVYGFPGTVLISVNEEIVHGVPGDRVLQAGDLVKLDATVDKDGYVADAARSVVVAPAGVLALRLAACAEAAFRCALEVAQAGVKVNEIGRAVEQEVHRHGFHVVPELAGHGVGRTIHEPPTVPNTWNPNQRDVLREGMVLTIEPLISARPARPVEAADGWTLRTSDGSWAAHYEHTVVITRGYPVVLTEEEAAA